ncbi:MAG: formate--tetrahydrofolate ligase, partial [Actinomycetota bacterium]|nr:formate--tetrahydrofolate ligase [Actinomycetota bacterium]
PISPRKTLTVAAALAGGLVGSVGLVFLFQLLDPRLRREEELGERFRLPVLARVPRADRRRRGRRTGPIVPDALSPEAADAYRTLRAALTASKRRTGRGRVILVTGSTPSEGKSTTAINLAAALAAFEERVMLIEGDLRRPSIGKALNIATLEGVPSVLLEDVLFGQFKLADALVDTVLAPNVESRRVRLLLANPDGVMPQPLSPALLRSILTAACSISDWVVIDGPPLLFEPDLLGVSELIDDVILVARLGTTVVDNLGKTAEMLVQYGVRPAGFVVIGTTGRPEYY